jgi:hypothetical protein
MNKVLVRCWKVENYRVGANASDHLFITYPEDNSGHELITCKNCGELYAITIVKEIYVGPPLNEKLRGIKCIKCAINLDSNFAYYPENYFVNGEMFTYRRDVLIPRDNESLVREFYGVYE